MKKSIILSALTTLLWASLPAFAQVRFEAKPQKKQLLIGEPLLISLEITGPTEARAEIPDSLGRFEILEVKEPEVNATSSVQQIVVTCFDSGTFRLPPIGLNDGSGIYTAGFDLEVGTLPADSIKNFGDLKQISGMAPSKQWPYWLAIGLAALIAGIILWWLYRKKKKKPAVIAEEVPEQPLSHPQLLSMFDELETAWRCNNISSLDLGNQLVLLFFKHLATKGFYQRSKTGEEIILVSKGWYDAENWQNLAQSIRLCNAMRFGKYKADVPQGMEAISHFRKCVQLGQTPDEAAIAAKLGQNRMG